MEEALHVRIARRRRSKIQAPLKNVLLVALTIVVLIELADIVSLHNRVAALVAATLTTSRATTLATSSASTSVSSTSTTQTSSTTSTIKLVMLTYNTTAYIYTLGVGNYTLTYYNPKLQLPAGTYAIIASPVVAYHQPTFYNWVVTGNITMVNKTLNPTSVTISGNGTVGLNYRLYCATCPTT